MRAYRAECPAERLSKLSARGCARLGRLHPVEWFCWEVRQQDAGDIVVGDGTDQQPGSPPAVVMATTSLTAG
jgi:hypothetical protein